MKALIEAAVSESLRVKNLLFEQADLIEKLARGIIKSLESSGKLLVCGNGGSAADAQHAACELIGRFRKERASLPAIALTTDTSIITAVANDYGYEEVFARQVEGLARPGDCLLAISTSGNAESVLRAVETAREKGIWTAGLTGASGGLLAQRADLVIKAPSQETPRIQECHVLILHIICDLVESHFHAQEQRI